MKDGIEMMTKENLDEFIECFKRILNTSYRMSNVDNPIHSVIIHPVMMDDIRYQINKDIGRRASCNFSERVMTIYGVKIDDKHYKDREIAELKSMLEAAFNACSVKDMMKVNVEYENYCRRIK